MKLKSLLLGIGLACTLPLSSGLQAASSAGKNMEMPAAKASIVSRLTASGKFKTLIAALKATDLVATLEGEGPFTILAPTDQAFAKLGKETLDRLLANPEELKSILLYHVVEGRVMAMEAFQAGQAATVNGAGLKFEKKGLGFFINNARVLLADVPASNGVIHVIDTVLLPPAEVPAD